ncbi:histone acetylation protein-domain-containing protein [Coniella lustricola]|uniref:histone acetyltransferase n=1 Tax=Coniella lustricola TaxID=2025994 RepID=A0A2T2ZYE1_9PEZI|nr:histone acetylation protein-domain-containing protein [Coniella lustricola]
MASTAALPGSPAAKQQVSSALHDKLAGVLPRGYKFTIHHLSTPPTRTDPLYSPPPGARPDRTYRESHFLAVSIDAIARPRDRSTPTSLPSSPFTPGATASSDSSNVRQVLVLALEIFVFSTAWTTTFFVSKADSTGYLYLLNLPKGTPSPIRQVCSAFISYLVEERRRANVQTIVSLFARAQNQYLFPGSVENKGKHVLDDRGLVRWWCRVLNSVMEGQGGHEEALFRPSSNRGGWEHKKAYLVVPGLDLHESRAFLPRTPAAQSNWALAHPLERISHFANEYDWVPPRCLVPKFPDDPKSRYRDELDFEASKSAQYEEKGLWRSVTTMERFWEMMAFRQECSGGHMTGFLWLVLEPSGWTSAHNTSSRTEPLLSPSASFDGTVQLPITPPKRRDGLPASTPRSSPSKLAVVPTSMQQSPVKGGEASPAKRTKKTLKGPIQPRLPRVKKHARNYVPNIPTSTIYYSWPAEGRGTRIVAEADYKRAVDLLTKLDFETLELAVRSSKRWTSEVGGGQKWALDIIGQAVSPRRASIQADTINDMAGLVRRKLKTSDSGLGLADMEAESMPDEPELVVVDGTAVPMEDATPTVNVLSSEMLRKKPKTE